MDAILEAGASGLQYFAVFLPRAALVADVTGSGELSATSEQIEARYYEQRGIDLTALAADIEAIGRVGGNLDRTFDEQTRAVGALREVWAGDDAELACRHLAGTLARADRLRSGTHDVRNALVAAERELRAVVTRKSEWVRNRDATQIDGRGVTEIDRMLGTSGLLSDGSSVGAGPFAEASREWLTGVFLPHVRETLREFVAICDATETTVDDVYCTLARVFAQIDDSALPTPAALDADCRPRLPVATAQCGAAPVPATAPPTQAATPTLPAAALPAPLAASSLSGVERFPVLSGAAPSGAAAQGSLALDGAVRAVGAVVGVVAGIALDIVDGIVRASAESAVSGGSLDLEPERGCACDCAGECSGPAAPPAPPAPQPPPDPPAPEPQPTPAPAPTPEPAPDCPDDEELVVDDPVDPPAPSAPTVDDDPAVYCVPAPEPKPEPEPGALGAPGVPSMLGLPQGAAQGAARRRQEEQPAIAEMGPPPSPGEETGAVLAESGSW